jgi:hypothetical protein
MTTQSVSFIWGALPPEEKLRLTPRPETRSHISVRNFVPKRTSQGDYLPMRYG